MLDFYYIDPKFLRGLAEGLTAEPNLEPQDTAQDHFNLLMDHLTLWQTYGHQESLQDAAIALMNLYRVYEPAEELEVEFESEAESESESPAAAEPEVQEPVAPATPTAVERLKNLFRVA